MRVLLTSFAQDAHFSPSVPLAWALRTAGHEVRVASQPALTDSIVKAGLTAVPVGRDHRHEPWLHRFGAEILGQHQNADFLEMRHEKLDFDFLLGHFTVMCPVFWSEVNNDSMIRELVDFAQSWRPDLIIWEPFTFAGAVAARVSGAAHARLISFPDMFLSTRRRFLAELAQTPPENRDDALEEWLTWTLAQFNCPFDEEMITGQWSIDQTPRCVQLPLGQPTVTMRYIPYNGLVPTVVPDWLRTTPERPRVCITLGITSRKVRAFQAVAIEDLFETVSDLDIEAVLTLDAAQREALRHELSMGVPSNIRMVEHVPLDALLPTCSAIVHHGGAGTWTTAAAYGVPQIALSSMWDHFYRAKRLEELGAGLHLPAEELTASGLRGRLERLLNEPAFRDNADRLRQEMSAAPAPNDVVPVLEKLTARHRSR